MKELHITFNLKSPKYIQIYNNIKDLILESKLKCGEKLMSKRQLAQSLDVSLNTVIAAYTELLNEGYIISREKQGYYVNEILIEKKEIKPIIQEKKVEKNVLYDFKTNNINESLFTIDIYNKILRQIISNSNYLKRHKSGFDDLKFEIAKMLSSLKGIEVMPCQIFISRSSHDLINKLINFLNIKEVSFERPGFYKKEIFNIKSNYLSLDNEGIVLDDIKNKENNLIITTPFNEFPLGIKMSLKRKIEIINEINNSTNYLVEDAFDSSFRNNGTFTTPLFNLSNKVIYLESFSRTMFPGLCISFMVLPIELVDKFTEYIKKDPIEVSTLDQMALAKYIEENHFYRHINKLRTNLLNIKNEILNNLDKELFTEINTANYSSIIAKLNTPLSDLEIKEKLKKKSISINFLSDFGYSYEHYIIIGFTNISKNNVKEYLKYLENEIRR